VERFKCRTVCLNLLFFNTNRFLKCRFLTLFRLCQTQIKALSHVQTIAAGGHHAAAITNKGCVYQWGQKCADDSLTRFDVTPIKVRHINEIAVKSISCGTHHTVLVGNGRWYSGIAYAWGRDSLGCLGLGHRRDRTFYTPVCIKELYYGKKVVTQVSAGREHTGFLTKDGEVYTCGSNAFGQLGYFTASQRSSDVPRKVCLGNNATGEEIRFVLRNSSPSDPRFLPRPFLWR